MTAAFASFAKHQFELSEVQGGMTVREHLEVAWRLTGVKPEKLDGPGLPDGLSVLWRDFLALHSCRGSNGFGPSRISFTDIDAFQRVTGRVLASWEVEAIRKADDEFLASLPKGGGGGN